MAHRLVLSLAFAWLLAAGCTPATAHQQQEEHQLAAQQEADPPETDQKSPASDSPAGQQLQRAAQQAWLEMPTAPHQCETFDYFPDGGMYTVYCRLRNFATFGEVEDALSIPVFTRGPHGDGEIDRRSSTEFGHYNPEFVEELPRWVLPGAEDEEFRQQTQPIYECCLRDLARTYWATYQKLVDHPQFWHEQQQILLDLMETGGVPHMHYEQFFFFMNPLYIDNQDGGFQFFMDNGFDGGVYSGNVVKTAVGFWIRRGIDGTHAEFADGLSRLLQLYDPDFAD